MNVDAAALTSIRDHLDLMMYRLTDFRMSVELPPSRTGFPRYESLRRIVGRLNPEHETLFRLFRLGETVADEQFEQAFPARIGSALLETGLVVRDSGGWRTPGLLLVPANGLLLITGIPPTYPTAMDPPRAWFDMSTSFVAAALPHSLAGRRVLDVCSGVGTQALLCAARGATEVLGLELSEPAVTLARANARLNGLAVEFRQSDMLTALRAGERFDFVVANLPYAPALPGDRCPSTVAEIGNSLLWPLLDGLPAHLSESAQGILAIWRTIGRAGSSYQRQAIATRLAKAGYTTTAYADPITDTVAGVLGLLPDDLVPEARMLIETSAPMDGFYNQLVHFRPVSDSSPTVLGPTFSDALNGRR